LGNYSGEKILFSIDFVVKLNANAKPFKIELTQTQLCNGPAGWGIDDNNNGIYDDDNDEYEGASIIIKANSVEAGQDPKLEQTIEVLLEDFDKNPSLEISMQKPDVGLELVLNQSIYKPGDNIELELNTFGSKKADYYIIFILPDGIYLSFTKYNQLSDIYQLNPFHQKKLIDSNTEPIMSFPLSNLVPEGVYTIFGILTEPESDVLDLSNWLSPMSAVKFSFQKL